MKNTLETQDTQYQTSFYIEQPFTNIAAYPKAGKTSLAISLALDAILYCGKKVLFFTPGKEGSAEIRHQMVGAIKL